MNKEDIHKFFVVLDETLQKPAEIILTGAAAGALMGNIRPSLDIDFEIRLRTSQKKDQEAVEKAVFTASQKTGLAANYSEDISHWSMIDYLDYRKTARPYRTVGRLKIKQMDPYYWTIGKLARFYELDILDLKKIIQSEKMDSQKLARLWGKALRRSPLSLASSRFRDHVRHFLLREGKSVWGGKFDVEKTITLFERAAEMR